MPRLCNKEKNFVIMSPVEARKPKGEENQENYAVTNWIKAGTSWPKRDFFYHGLFERLATSGLFIDEILFLRFKYTLNTSDEKLFQNKSNISQTNSLIRFY